MITFDKDYVTYATKSGFMMFPVGQVGFWGKESYLDADGLPKKIIEGIYSPAVLVTESEYEMLTRGDMTFGEFYAVSKLIDEWEKVQNYGEVVMEIAY